MRISEKIIRVGLIVMIALSFYFSYMIWLNPTGFNNASTETDTGVNPSVQTYKQKSDLFLPLYLTWNDEEDIKETNSEAVTREIQEVINEATISDLTLRTYGEEQAFSKAQEVDQGISLNYYTTFYLKDYEKTFDKELSLEDESETEDFPFSRIQFDLEENTIQFVDFTHQRVVRGKIDWDKSQVKHLLADNPREWTAMRTDQERTSNQYYTQDSIKLKKYSYYSSTQSQSLFREAFFNNPKNVKINDESVDTYYYEGGQNMTVLQDQQQVKFETTTDGSDETDLAMLSADYIIRLGNNFGTIRYFDQQDKHLDYRVFVEGYPVFSTGGQGVISVAFSESGQTGSREMTISASLNAIQVPIPSETEIELPSSLSVKNDLIAAGADPESLQQIIVGYQWGEIKDAPLVDLTPAWYVNYDSSWISYDALMTKLAETEGN
ncbi:YycH family regulatory protein [Enterococcus innesii]|uniref:YycH family regulatory protein n=1 Tax=Enterococcus innesii TaxID=2839759 RepID=UPI00232E3D82|nr:two-component system activity regulator YycH [Enterococcus innesii]MDC0752074.1 two-component system activity regulator YycH [Enterococcus innesii]MDC0776162.1 two-component system activity regulator YycH [Enterococcus innesii]MDC0779193.1 two-component system activity regulator YycH [Enterococcus innesii]MDC0782929.1 two-component system activity regulator YycH [Enterococcus innesii]